MLYSMGPLNVPTIIIHDTGTLEELLKKKKEERIITDTSKNSSKNDENTSKSQFSFSVLLSV